MSTLSSSSTDSEVWAAFDDNASYEEDGSRTKALAFLTACRILLRRRPKRMRQEGFGESEFDEVAIRQEMRAAQSWLARHPASSDTGAGSVRYGNLQGFRD